MTSLTESKAKQKVEGSLQKHILSPDFNFRILSTDNQPQQDLREVMLINQMHAASLSHHSKI
jgi:hypothetical protein